MRARAGVRVLRRCRAAWDVREARQPTFCKVALRRSCRLVGQHSVARRLALAWGWHHSFRRAARIVPAAALVKSVMGKLEPAIDSPIPLLARAVREQTSGDQELPMWADRELRT